MHYPPSDVCRALARIPKTHLRLAWRGELGVYSLLQLYQRRDAEATFLDRWTSELGPTFTKTGVVGQDWDPWARIPIYLTDVPPNIVHGSGLVHLVKSRWIRPLAARIEENRRQMGKQLESDIQAMGKEGGRALYYKAQHQSSHHAPIVPKEFQDPGDKYQKEVSGEATAVDHFMPPAPPGGWEKHKSNDEGDSGDLGSV